MASLRIELPDDLRSKAQHRATEAGHESLESYIASLIEADAEGEDWGAPEYLRMQSDEQLEQFLSDRADEKDTIEATPEFWRQLKERAAAERERRSS